jgi:arginine N-succinyltransferase
LPAEEHWLVANERVRDFRACLCQLSWTPGEPVILSETLAQLLNVAEGDSIRLMGEA